MAEIAKPLARSEARRLIEQARRSFPHDACLTCECFLGYVAQIGIDADEGIRSLLAELGIVQARTHSCLGCEPCPPADLFAAYLRDSDQ